MHVCFLTPAYGASGGMVGRHVEALAAGVVRNAGTAEVLVYGTRAPESRAGDGVRVTWVAQHFARLDRPFPKPLIAQLRGCTAAADVVHVHGRRLLATLHAAHPSLPHLVCTPHYYALSPEELRHLAQGREHRRDQRLVADADLVLCVSHSEALHVIRSAPGARIQVIPNGVDAPAIVAAHPLPVEGRVILTVDRLTRWTGIHRIISALPALSSTYGLVVIGGGRGRSALDAHAEYMRVDDRIRFLGRIDDRGLHRWLRTASVLVTLKEESLWGGMLLAATAAGTPVVASDMPANREAALLAGRDGISFVSRRASPFVVADAIRDQALAGSRAHAERVATWEEMADQTFSAYRDLRSTEALRGTA